MTDKGGAQRFSALVIIAALAAPLPAIAQQPSSADVNAANNPLTPKITINFQDQSAPELYDLDQGSNTFEIGEPPQACQQGRWSALSTSAKEVAH